MNLKKSWVNVPLLKNIIKRNTLLAKISLIAVLTFSIMGFFGSGATAASIALFGMSAAILTTCYAGNIQKYMTNKTEANFMASLPIDSFVLWFTHYLAGLLLVVLPLWTESIVIAIVQKDNFSITGSPIGYLVAFQLTTILLAIIYYTISFFVSCIAGNRLGQFLYTIAFYAMPALLYIVIVWGGEALAFGNFTTYSTDLLFLCIPLASGLDFISNGTWSYGIGHSLITIGFFVAGYYVFKKRSIENTGEAILYKLGNIVFRTIVVVILSLFTFIILSKVIAIIPDCRTSTILLGGCIFVVLGCLLALLVEIIFKNEHIYKSIVYYIPIFILSYLGCYAYGNFAYQDLKQEILANEEVTLYAYGYNLDNNHYYDSEFETFKSKDVKKLLQELEKNPEKIYKNNVMTDERNYIELEVCLDGELETSRKSFTITVDKEYFNEVSEKNSNMFANPVDTNMVSEIENNEQEYWYLYDYADDLSSDQDAIAEKFLVAALTRQDVLKITAYLQSEEYQKNTTAFTSKMSLIVDGAKYTFRLDRDFLNQLTNEKNVIKQTRQMNACINAFEMQIQDITTFVPELGEGAVTSISNFNPVTDYHIIDDTTVKSVVTYEIYDESTKKTALLPCVITLVVQGDDVKVMNVERGKQ